MTTSILTLCGLVNGRQTHVVNHLAKTITSKSLNLTNGQASDTICPIYFHRKDSMDINREDLAWAGGLFEGEGSINWSKIKNRNPKLPPWGVCGMSLHMTDEDVVRKFHKIVGIGRVHGPYNYSTKSIKRKSSWYWCIQTFERVQAIAAILWPWLGTRRRCQYKEVFKLEMQARPPGRTKGARRSTVNGRFE